MIKKTATKEISTIADSLSGLNLAGSEAALCSDTALFHIDAKGEWHYQQSPLPVKFAKLFSSILHCVDNQHYLITPVEKVKVTVEDRPLFLVDVEQTEQGYRFASQLGTYFNATCSDIVLNEDEILVKLERNLIGKLNRACYYRYIDSYLSD